MTEKNITKNIYFHRLKKVSFLNFRNKNGFHCKIHTMEPFNTNHPNIKVLPLVVKDSIKRQDVHNVIKFFREISPWSNVLLVLHVPSGGCTDECSRICNAIQRHSGKVTIFVPEIAASSGSQIALSGHQLIMGKNACLTPIDDQMDDIPAKEMHNIRKILKKKRKPDGYVVEMLSLSLEDYANIIESKRMLKMTEKEVVGILSKKYGKKTIQNVVDTFIHHKTYHVCPLYTEKLQNIGIEICTDVDNDYYELFDQLYDQIIVKKHRKKKIKK